MTRVLRITATVLLLTPAADSWAAGERASEAGSEPESIVVLVPGITGSKLRDVGSGETIWGEGRNLLRPLDGGYSLVRPLGEVPSRPSAEAFDLIERLRVFGVARKQVYGPILELVEENGYQIGSFENPRPGDDFFPFPWDWRQDLLLAIRDLTRSLENLRSSRGTDPLRVALICQSSGGQICRYLAKYGGVGLDEAEANPGSLPAGIEVTKVILVGTANGGSLRSFRELLRGRKYIAVVGRRLEPETLFTFPSLFQDLPSYRSGLFLDPGGQPLDVDLFHADNWETYGWSIFDPQAQRRLAKAERTDLFGDREARLEYLRSVLDSAQRFQALLAKDSPGFTHPQYFSIQNSEHSTPDRAVLVPRAESWQVLFTGDDELVHHASLVPRVSALGDGHATVDSQEYLSPQEKAAMADDRVSVDGGHFDLILNGQVKELLIEYLRSP